MRLIQWTPQTLARQSSWNDIDREFDRMMSWAFGNDVPESSGAMTPAMDFVEEKDHFRVALDLPGLTKEDIEVTMHDGVLTVRGERKAETEEKQEGRLVRRERFRGTFERTMRLPKKVDANKIEATFRNGVLELNIPFAAEAQPIRLQLKD
ncbi:MAG: Hsp20/alpha crystallin family protein [Candidatus Eisenbacteria bacterium]|uniref:Hsp20/alpha crystallin family protein n=1 Tax=Eiseniibacteriota bacterium TaxID=2212470 RepID=A0A956M0Z4_UNCEI|nr:Hsp20/alpha crystallin family protein [Candidatus Eisenbacteria bacterium]